MKYISLILAAILWVQLGWSQNTKIEWTPIEELEQKMEQEPRRIIFDVYTDWCGWCKVMERKTYGNEKVAAYINKNYYAVKLNAEGKQPISFMGMTYEYQPQMKLNDLAIQLLMGKYSYPTTVFMEKNTRNIMPIPGYLTVKDIEPILKYFNEAADQGLDYQEWEKDFKREWK